jgi:hypothetical protein
MTSVADLLRALPIRDIRVKTGSTGNCGGTVVAVVDLEPGTTDGVEMTHDHAGLPDWADNLPEIVEEDLTDIEFGLRTALREQFGAEPPVRAVVRRLNTNPADANQVYCRHAGRRVAEAALRMTTTACLLRALPIREIKARAGTAGNCGGIVVAVVDLEPGTVDGIDLDYTGAELPGWADDDLRDIAAQHMADIEVGLREALHDRLGADPPVRAVVRRLGSNPSDGNKYVCMDVGRKVVDEALRRADGS